MPSKKLDKEVVRQAATGRWLDILSGLGGIPIEQLTGKHGPCPKCGGEDRFSMCDETAGALICRHCFSTKNGDGFSALQWLLGIKFSEALRLVAEYVGVAAKKGDADPAKDLEFQAWSTRLVAHFLAAKSGVTERALLAAGAKMARYKRQFTVIAFPIIGQDLNTAKPVGWILANYNGQPLPKWSPKGEIVGQTKYKITYGSKPGLVGVHAIERMATAGLVDCIWKVEGVSDLLALMSIVPDDQTDRQVVVTNANGAGEIPRWPASMLAKQNCHVLHDADQPGQAGAERWVTLIAAQSEAETRNVQLPYEVSDSKGKDLRDWLNDGNTFKDLQILANQSALVAVAKTVEGEIDFAKMDYPVQRVILKKLQCEVLYEDESGKVRVFSTCLKKSSLIPRVSRMTKEDLVQCFGGPAKEIISREPDNGETFSLADVREAIALAASGRRASDKERGVGIWQGIDELGNETDSIVIVGSTEAARWDGDQVLKQIIAPQCDGLTLDFGSGSHDWYHFETLEANLKAAVDEDWRRTAIDQAKQLFQRWRWPHEVDPTLVVGLTLASWIQTIWDWRPVIAITGESNSGKSFLFEALGGTIHRRGLFGKLAFKQAESSEAGIRQGVGNTAVIPICDEFEGSKERDKIFKKLIRPSTRGESVARGTADQKGTQFTLRHIVWVAAIESGLQRQPDLNRFIQLELLTAEKGKFGQLRLPSGGELYALGQKLLAIAVRGALETKRLAAEMKDHKVPGIDGRTIESYAVPAACLAVAVGYDESQSRSLLADLLANVDRQEQGRTDQAELLDAILTAPIFLSPSEGTKTISQILESDALRASHGERLEAEGLKVLDNGALFLSTKTVPRRLLRGTEFERLRIDQILCRMSGAKRGARRLGGRSLRGVIIPGEFIFPDRNLFPDSF